MYDREEIIIGIICAICVIVCAICGWFLSTDAISDSEFEEEKQRIYEMADNTPKDVEKAIGTENLEITGTDTITYRFSGNQCSLTLVYDEEYNVIEETFQDQRNDGKVSGVFLGAGLGFLLGLLGSSFFHGFMEWYAENEYARLVRKHLRQNKKQEKKRKKVEKQKSKNTKINVIQQ